MLVLTRKLGENIRIGDTVKITVLEVRSGQVKLGIEAPHETSVHREEVHRRICQENLRAAAHAPEDLEDVMRAFATDQAAERSRRDEDGKPS